MFQFLGALNTLLLSSWPHHENVQLRVAKSCLVSIQAALEHASSLFSAVSLSMLLTLFVVSACVKCSIVSGGFSAAF